MAMCLAKQKVFSALKNQLKMSSFKEQPKLLASLFKIISNLAIKTQIMLLLVGILMGITKDKTINSKIIMEINNNNRQSIGLTIIIISIKQEIQPMCHVVSLLGHTLNPWVETIQHKLLCQKLLKVFLVVKKMMKAMVWEIHHSSRLITTSSANLM